MPAALPLPACWPPERAAGARPRRSARRDDRPPVRGSPDEAYDRLAAEPEDLRRWISGLWRRSYAALKAEAAVLIGQADVCERLVRARTIATGNPIATAIVDRASSFSRTTVTPC